MPVVVSTRPGVGRGEDEPIIGECRRGGPAGDWADGDPLAVRSAGDRRSHGRGGGIGARDRGVGAAMIPVPSGVRVTGTARCDVEALEAALAASQARVSAAEARFGAILARALEGARHRRRANGIS